MLNPDDGVSLEALDLLHRAVDNPDAYWHDVEEWMASDDSVCAAEGNLIAGAACRVEDPVRAIAYFEEARRLFIGRNYYPEAATTTRILSLLFEHRADDRVAAELHRTLAAEYRDEAESGKHPRIEPPLMDDDHA